MYLSFGKGFYNGMKIQRSDGFVIQTGDSNPDGDVHGYVSGGKERKIPLEIAVKKEKELLYSATTGAKRGHFDTQIFCSLLRYKPLFIFFLF